MDVVVNPLQAFPSTYHVKFCHSIFDAALWLSKMLTQGPSPGLGAHIDNGTEACQSRKFGGEASTILGVYPKRNTPTHR